MLHDGLLAGKVALVTGSARGIGKKTVERFAEEGALVYATDRTEGSLDCLLHNINAQKCKTKMQVIAPTKCR